MSLQSCFGGLRTEACRDPEGLRAKPSPATMSVSPQSCGSCCLQPPTHLQPVGLSARHC